MIISIPDYMLTENPFNRITILQTDFASSAVTALEIIRMDCHELIGILELEFGGIFNINLEITEASKNTQLRLQDIRKASMRSRFRGHRQG